MKTPNLSGASATGTTNGRYKKKKWQRLNTETANCQTGENNSAESDVVYSCVIQIEWLVGCVILGGFVAYFIVTSASTTASASDRTFTAASTFPPTSVPFLFDPPALEDCRMVRVGESVSGQELLVERNFDINLDVTMRVGEEQVNIAMELLELGIQEKLLPNIIGCEVQNGNFVDNGMRSNPNRFIVGNGRVKWRSSAEFSECAWTCFSTTLKLDLFLKTSEDQYFFIMNLLEDIFQGDLFYSLQLESPPFLSVMFRSVNNNNPTQAPTKAPTFVPSNNPTNQPSVPPSKSPTFQPSSRPTVSPTVSSSPTSTPPSLKPTDYSPMVPSMNPSTSINPTAASENKGYFQPLDRPIRVACAGDSLTRGRSGGLPAGHSYPFQLQAMLGEMFNILNFGRNAATALRGLSTSYVDMQEFQNSLSMEPDIYLLMLGTNDSREWEVHATKFRADMEWIVDKVRSILFETTPRIIVAIPPWVKTDNFGIRNDVLVTSIQPDIQSLAILKNLQIVNMYDDTLSQLDIFISDGVHLNKEGYRLLADAWQSAILCNSNGICEVGENCTTCPADCYLNC